MPERSRLLTSLIEGAVIVGSILLAFAIDAAWENYRESRVRAELIAHGTIGEELQSPLLGQTHVVTPSAGVRGWLRASRTRINPRRM